MGKTIAYITDIHLDEEYPISAGVDAAKNWEIIQADIRSRSITHLIFGGDIGDPASNKKFFESIHNISADVMITLGNHDTYTEVKKHYSNSYTKNETELYYSFEEAGYRFIFLDSSSDRISDIQLEWLRTELTVTEKKIVLFIHHPVLAVDTTADKLYPLLNRDSVKAILTAQQKQVLIFCGHYHMEDEQTAGNIKQLITPAVSYQIIKEAPSFETGSDSFGYRLIHIAGDTITSELIMFKSPGKR